LAIIEHQGNLSAAFLAVYNCLSPKPKYERYNEILISLAFDKNSAANNNDANLAFSALLKDLHSVPDIIYLSSLVEKESNYKSTLLKGSRNRIIEIINADHKKPTAFYNKNWWIDNNKHKIFSDHRVKTYLQGWMDTGTQNESSSLIERRELLGPRK